MTPVALMVGANRIVPAAGIIHPLGSADLSPEDEKTLRRRIVETCTVGSPARSSSRAIAAPQRVLVPHVDVRMTASTPAARSFSAISAPIRALCASVVATPTVE